MMKKFLENKRRKDCIPMRHLWDQNNFTIISSIVQSANMSATFIQLNFVNGGFSEYVVADSIMVKWTRKPPWLYPTEERRSKNRMREDTIN